MTDNHQHPEQPQQPPQQPQVMRRPPSNESVLQGLQARLDQKATQIRQLEDNEVHLNALVLDRDQEVTNLQAILSQVRAENLILRQRLGLGETEPVELTDDEVAGLSDEVSVEVSGEPDDSPGPV